MNARLRTVVLRMVICQSLAGSTLVAVGQSRLTAQQILRVWKQRQDRVKTLKFQWVQTERQTGLVMGDPSHPEGVAHEVAMEVSIDGGMVRHSARGPKFSPDHNAFFPTWSLNVYDGDINKQFYGYADANDARLYPLGFVTEKSIGNLQSGTPSLRPIVMNYRNLHPAFMKMHGWIDDPADYVLSSKTGFVDGHECVVLERSNRSKRPPSSYWVDPARDCIVLRRVFGESSKPSMQLDVTYARDPAYGWVPSAWKFVAMDAPTGKLLFETVAKVLRYEFNEPIPRSEFRFDFPVGTRVNDQNARQSYIVREGGEKRVITRGELRARAKYEEIVATPSGQALSQRRERSRAVWYWAFAIVALGLLLISLRRWRKRQREAA